MNVYPRSFDPPIPQLLYLFHYHHCQTPQYSNKCCVFLCFLRNKRKIVLTSRPYILCVYFEIYGLVYFWIKTKISLGRRRVDDKQMTKNQILNLYKISEFNKKIQIRDGLKLFGRSESIDIPIQCISGLVYLFYFWFVYHLLLIDHIRYHYWFVDHYALSLGRSSPRRSLKAILWREVIFSVEEIQNSTA